MPRGTQAGCSRAGPLASILWLLEDLRNLPRSGGWGQARSREGGTPGRCGRTTPPAFSPQRELRPRLCAMKKGPNGYGFNLHSDKSKPGQFIRAVDPDSPAEASGLRAQDRIVEVV